MKICVVMPNHWSGSLGGAEIQVKYLLEHLRQHTAHELSIVCRLSKINSDQGVPVYRTTPILPLSRYTYCMDYWSAEAHLRSIAPDVIYTRTVSPFVGFAARYCNRFGARLVYHIAHVEDVLPRSAVRYRSFFRRAERVIYEYGLRHAEIVIAQAKYQSDLLCKNFGRPATAIIPNFHPEPAASPRQPSERLIVWVANIKQSKRPEAFIDLARRLSGTPHVRFAMVGALHDYRYAELMSRVSSDGNIQYLGPLSQEAVNNLLDDAYLFVNTSAPISEGFPNTFIQAWLRAVPVLSLDVDPDSVLDQMSLGVCGHGSLSTLEEGLTRLLADRQERDRMGERARQFARKHHGLQNCEKIAALLEGR